MPLNEDEPGKPKTRSDTGKIKSRIQDIPQYIVAPSYGKGNPNSGGIRASVTLGPRSLGKENAAAREKLGAMSAIENEFPKTTFIAGHLLNGLFGGDGQDRNNLTILTSSANGQHKLFDNRIKDAVGELMNYYVALKDAFVDVTKVKFGIQISIVPTDPKWGNQEPQRYVYSKLKCTATIVGEYDLNTIEVEKLKDDATKSLNKIKAFIKRANDEGGNVSNAKPEDGVEEEGKKRGAKKGKFVK